MNTVALIIIEVVALLILGIPVVYLVWRLGYRKVSFGNFIDKYGYGITYIAFIVIGIMIAIIRTMTLER